MKIDGLDGYEILASGKDKKTGEKMFVCQVTLFEETDYYIMQGITRMRDQKRYLPIFRKTISTFARKKAKSIPAANKE